ncbi:response regulator [Azospirillum sp. RWY-5-1]|uniref:protein-glutamate methylesterase n=1 Tax=Azospirillum oleiclasticum TaxID=2735135 RepID=A0ABX2TIM5_9PROT|nr:chemotaxis protein CheB [Azospirillum oleiclasticum]NYZ17759.1 response regulator [Azospirillum oleiclasticum]NYZ24195.1 response regulator [Azospirillum oleiclasticum]
MTRNDQPRRVLIVDDSAFMRASLRHIVGALPGFTVAGEAKDGREAVEVIRRDRPDIVTLDIDMPLLDGIGVLRELRPVPGTAPLFIMVSAFTTAGADLTLTALGCGAIDFVPKASEHFRTDLAQVGDLLRSKLAIAGAVLAGQDGRSRPLPVAAPRPSRPAAAPPAGVTTAGVPDVVVVACSTGGPQTLPELLRPLCPCPVPVVVAQHIPPVFSRSLAASLAVSVECPVVEAEDGKPLAAGTVHVLPGGFNGELVRLRPGVLAVRLTEGGAALHRPNADILFRSAALTARRPVGIILTGMGCDGTEGARALVQRGCPVLVQDPATAVIWGMPRAAIDAGLASEVLDPAAIGRRVALMTGRRE